MCVLSHGLIPWEAILWEHLRFKRLLQLLPALGPQSGRLRAYWIHSGLKLGWTSEEPTGQEKYLLDSVLLNLNQSPRTVWFVIGVHTVDNGPSVVSCSV